jgi:hypothetical protein
MNTLAAVAVSVVVAFWPVVAGAQPSSSGDFAPTQLRAEFARRGYTVDMPIRWGFGAEWPTITSFNVSHVAEQSDPGARIALVMIFPDTASAQMHRSIAETYGDAATRSMLTPERGPHLVSHFGFSAWRQNVAVVESNPGGLDQSIPDSFTSAVDPEFLAVLDNVQTVAAGS